jgi:hypothetical protein
MSTELGQLFSDGLGYSNAIFDAKTIVVHEGSYITAIPQATQFGAARSLDGSGGLRKDEFYWPNAERDSLIPAHWAHKHKTSNYWDGGSHREIILANLKEVWDKLYNPGKGEFQIGVSGTGSVVDSGNQVRLHAGAGDADSHAEVKKGGGTIGWTSKIFWRAITWLDDDTSVLCRQGMGMEHIQNNADNEEKLGLEGCDGDGPQWRMVSANGIGRHKEPTPFPVESTVPQGYALVMEPGTTLTIQWNDGTVIANPDNVPSVGVNDPFEIVKFGVKTTNTNDKQLRILMVDYYGTASSGDWVQPSVTA